MRKLLLLALFFSSLSLTAQVTPSPLYIPNSAHDLDSAIHILNINKTQRRVYGVDLMRWKTDSATVARMISDSLAGMNLNGYSKAQVDSITAKLRTEITAAAGGGSITSVTATAPLFSTGGANPNVAADTTTSVTGLATKGNIATNAAAINSKFTLPALTSGSVLFSDGTTIAQKNSNLFWDNTNNSLGINKTSPLYTLDVGGNGINAPSIRLGGGSSIVGNYGYPILQQLSPYTIVFGGTASNNYILFQTKTQGTLYPAQVDFKLDNNLLLAIRGNGVGIGGILPTALLTIAAGTATAGTAPLKLTSGINLTTPESGAVEFDGTDYFVTPSSGTRYKLVRTLSGSAAPTTTPLSVGVQFVDTTNKKIYVSTGTTSSADWTILN